MQGIRPPAATDERPTKRPAVSDGSMVGLVIAYGLTKLMSTVVIVSNAPVNGGFVKPPHLV